MRKTALFLIVGLFASALFVAPALAATSVTITGGGWGHGLGMSQYGAYGRALNGKSATQILKRYYTDVSVTERKMPRKIRVGLLQSRSSIGVSPHQFRDGGGRIVWKEQGKSGRIAGGGLNATWKVEPSSTGGMRLFKNGSRVRRDGRSVFGSPSRALVAVYQKHGTSLGIEGKAHKYPYGKLDVGTHSSNDCAPGYCLRAVLKLGMQKYLYGLGEVPSSWPRAVLEAQAIAGRTYAFDKVKRSGQHRQPCDCAVFDSVLDQAYIGDSKRTGSGQYWSDWKGAVNATKSTVILHNGAPITALYSSSSGGHTENNENVWGDGTQATAIAYLRGVRDRADRAQGNNPNYKWKETMSYSAFESKLQAAYDIGSLQEFKLLKPFGVSDRVIVARDDGTGGGRIRGSKRTVHVDGWSLRSALSLRDSLFRVEIIHEVGGLFTTKYERLDGAPGKPTGDPYDVPRGWKNPRGKAQDFSKGRMTRVFALDKTVWQYGKVLRKYDRLGREKSVLGMPASDIWGPGTYRGADYARGMIVWSERFGAHPIRKKWRAAYRRVGGVRGPLGVPRAKAKAHDSLPDGRRQRFDMGTLYKGPAVKKVFALWGEIDARYRRLGAATSSCGYPTADMATDGTSASATFEGGVISWTPDDGVIVDCA
ncbi:MAG: SpoIID/LytB domain-containing protein [Actinomycetota bacterium]